MNGSLPLLAKLPMRGLLLPGICLALGLALWATSLDGTLMVQSFQVEVRPHHTLVGRLYRPVGREQVPGLVLCHGVNSSKDTLAPLAREFARRGMAAVVFDFGGYGRSDWRPNSLTANYEEASRILTWLAQQPGIDPQRLGVMGHSMGGTTALALAQAHPNIRTTLLLSMAGVASPTHPANLLLATGVYEELNPVPAMQTLFAETNARHETAPFVVLGDFQRGTARSLVVSATTDHALAPYDAHLQLAMVHWAEQSFGLPVSALPLVSQPLVMGWVFGGVGFLGLLRLGYTELLKRYGRLAPLISGVSLVTMYWLGRHSFGSGVAIAGLVPLLIAHYNQRQPTPGSTSLRRLLGYITLGYGLFLLALVVNAIVAGSIGAFPSRIWGLPSLAFNLPFGLIYDRFHLLRYGVDSWIGFCLIASILLLEMRFPGTILHQMGHYANKMLGIIRQPIVWQWQRISRKTLVLLVVLVVLWIAVLVWQQQQGILTWDSVGYAMRLISVFIIFPGIIGIGLIRSRLWNL